jgi:hypothetical protein
MNNKYKVELAKITNTGKVKGGLDEAILGADIFIGLSKPGVLKKEMIKSMKERPIVLRWQILTRRFYQRTQKMQELLLLRREEATIQIR